MAGRGSENGTPSPDKTAKVCKKKKQVKKKGICCCHFLHFPFIHNFHIDHNASCLPPPPPNLHNHCFRFLLGITVIPIEIEENGYGNFGGVNKVHYDL